jgi:hypothetical protein
MQPFTSPRYKLSAFNCPFCLAFAKQEWSNVYSDQKYINYIEFSECMHCHKYTIWHSKLMIYPEVTMIEPANPDLPIDLVDDYKEAASISQKSPRGSAALLRLAIQKLCIFLGEKGKDINGDIKNLVKKGLPIRIQKALDIVRVTGNEAVHPGVLDLKDDQETAQNLFKLLNFIADKMISEPKSVDELFDALPEEKKEQIKQRDLE